jgi:hypothetical protein
VAEPDLIDFTLDDPSPLLERVRDLADRRNGWVNVQPVPPDDDIATRRGKAGVFALLAGRGPELPVATWVPGELTRKGLTPDSVGLQHAGGPKARFRLADEGVPIPDGWRLLADHPRRGLVLELPEGTSADQAIEWLLRAAVALAPDELPRRWVALVYHR